MGLLAAFGAFALARSEQLTACNAGCMGITSAFAAAGCAGASVLIRGFIDDWCHNMRISLVQTADTRQYVLSLVTCSDTTAAAHLVLSAALWAGVALGVVTLVTLLSTIVSRDRRVGYQPAAGALLLSPA